MTGLQLALPDWLEKRVAAVAGQSFPTPESRMDFVLALCREQVDRDTGGPFSAAIFDSESGTLLAAGVNRVEAENCSLLHAEMVAIALAQQHLGCWNLSAGQRTCELVSSAAPCAMCLGAIPWAGLRSLVCAARDEDVRAIGFDEGCKPAPWTAGLVDAGISVHEDVQREVAAGILRSYAARGGGIYNA